MLNSATQAFDQAAEAAKKALSQAGDEATAAFTRATNEAHEVAARLSKDVDAARAELAQQADQFASEKVALLRAFEAEKRQLLVAALAGKMSKAISYLMNIVAVKIKDGLDDPYMPRCVKGWIDAVVDAVWPDIAEDLREAIFQLAHPAPPIDHGEAPCCAGNSCCSCCTCCGGGGGGSEADCCCCCTGGSGAVAVPASSSTAETGGGCDGDGDGDDEPCCRFYGPVAWFRYTMFPYDRNIWRVLRSPGWWVLTIIAAVPRYGVAQAYYLLWFLLMDRDDEYQLMLYITSFKSLQFVSLGVLTSIIGSVQYFVCTSPVPDSCYAFAPREEIFTLALFVTQTILVWVAFCFLGSAKNKGGLYYQVSQARAEKLKREAAAPQAALLACMSTEAVEEAYFEGRADDTAGRGRLWALLVYDTVVFAICVGLTLFAAFANQLDPAANVQNFYGRENFASSPNWKFVGALYWIKAFYGLMSFPFLLLLVPGVSSLFCHAKPTGYNPFGVCVPLLGVEEDASRVPWRKAASHRPPPQCGAAVAPHPLAPAAVERAEAVAAAATATAPSAAAFSPKASVAAGESGPAAATPRAASAVTVVSVGGTSSQPQW